MWGMKQMFETQRSLKGTEGLLFHKMLGTGGGDGYGFKPDFTTYALLTVWETGEKAELFESASATMMAFRSHANEVYSLFLRPVQSRGRWSGKEPFVPAEPDPANRRIVVLTRATLKSRYYIPFWRRVGKVSASHIGRPGLLFSKGVGERPWIMQATFSAWRSLEDMTAFAHDRKGRHYEAIATTRRLKGFKEELYARFQPLETRGSWMGKDPVGEVNSNNQISNSKQ
jgi:heme-degrading monooxygenase HmoA